MDVGSFTEVLSDVRSIRFCMYHPQKEQLAIIQHHPMVILVVRVEDDLLPILIPCDGRFWVPLRYTVEGLWFVPLEELVLWSLDDPGVGQVGVGARAEMRGWVWTGNSCKQKNYYDTINVNCYTLNAS